MTLQSIDARVARLEALVRVGDLLKISPFPVVSKRAKDADRVIDWVCKKHRISKEEFLGKTCSSYLTWPRQLAVYVMRNAYGLRHEDMNRVMRRTNGAAGHALRSAQDKIDTEPKARAEAEAAMKEFGK